MNPLVNALFSAVQLEKISLIDSALSRGVDINSTNLNGDSVLHLAIQRHYIMDEDDRIFCYLINAGVNVNLINKNGKTALQIFLDKYCDLTIAHKHKSFNNSVLTLIINAGADVNIFGVTNQITALHYSALIGDIDLMRLLVKKGADLNLQFPVKTSFGPDSLTALIFLIREMNEEMVRCLIDGGANVNAQTLSGTTALMRVCYSYGDSHVLATIAKILISSGADVNIQNDKGETALHFAVQFGQFNLIKLLVQMGANVNAETKTGLPPLHYVLFNENSKTNLVKSIVRYLLKKNADINKVTNEGNHILEFFWTFTPPVLSKILIEHLVKEISNGCSLHPKLHQFLSQKCKSYFEMCADELEKMREYKLSSGKISMLNLLLDLKKQLNIYACDRVLVSSFYNLNFEIFPIYGDFIKQRFLKVIEKKILLEIYAVSLSSCLPNHLDPYHLVIRKILSFCKIKDLKKLCDA